MCCDIFQDETKSFSVFDDVDEVEVKVGRQKATKHEWDGVPIKHSVLDDAKRIINGERQDQYGKPEDSFVIIAEYWTTYINARCKSLTIDMPVVRPVDVANMMILFKQARKLGQKPARDNSVDSCGYEAIYADRLMDFDKQPDKWED